MALRQGASQEMSPEDIELDWEGRANTMSKDIWTFKDTLAGKILTMVMSVILVTSTISTDALAFALNNPDADAAPVADVAESTKVTFEIGEGATVEVTGTDGQPVAVSNGQVVEAPSHEALTFTPRAEKGYTLESVTLGDKTLADKEDGTYEIAADDMAADPLAVKVKAQAEVEAAPEEAPLKRSLLPKSLQPPSRLPQRSPLRRPPLPRSNLSLKRLPPLPTPLPPKRLRL